MSIESTPNRTVREISEKEMEAGITPDLIKAAEDFLNMHNEANERDKASVSFTIDRASITKELELATNPDERSLLETFSRLPETLKFEPGLTLIIGANGSGKTTMAKSMYLSTELYQEEDLVKRSNAQAISYGLPGDPRHSIDSFINPQTEAKRRFLDPSSPYMSLWHAGSGLASKLSTAFQVHGFYSKGRAYYIDTSTIVGEIRAGEEEHFNRNTRVTIEDIAFASDRGQREKPKPLMSQKEAQEDIRRRSRERGSTRQTLDRKLPSMFRDDSGDHYSPSVFFFDEPEVGFDVFRHQKIIDEILSLVEKEEHVGNPRSITIIPTNSLKLFESDLPRIDLRYPERGIFRPSEYPEEK